MCPHNKYSLRSGAGYLIGLEALGADHNALDGAFDLGTHTLKIRQKAPLGFAITVADGVSGFGLFAAYITHFFRAAIIA